MIVSGTVRPGEYLRMEPIAEAVGVSNTPVREGLLTLQSEGFVRLVPHHGFVVAPFTQRDIRDLFWAQAQLAGELAARAAENRTDEQLDRLAANLERYDQAVANSDSEQITIIGHLFHREVNLAAGSRRLALLLASVVKHLPNRFYTTIEGQVKGAHFEHPMILTALRKRDARQARLLMEQHILEGGEHLIARLEDQGLWTEKAEDASAS
ncbi:GntR family transcriptional regulator [Pseudofrankia sp. BMG5.36]|nr:GntR family transcriptional regulator [Pseudofrankia sp. BMG5.36]